MTSTPSAISTISQAGFTVTSTSSPESLAESFPTQTETVEAKPSDVKEEEKDDKDPAAVALGKKGGQASAAMRKAEAKLSAKEAAKEKPAPVEKPEPAKPEETKEAAPEETDDKAEEKAEKPLGKPRDDPRARMLQATQQAAEAKREAQKERERADHLAKELAAERAKSTKPGETKTEAKADDDVEPKEEEFESYAEYVKASSRWAARQELKEHQKVSAERQKQEAQQTEAEKKAEERHKRIEAAANSFYQRIEEASKADPKFTEKTVEVAKLLRPSFVLPEGERPTALNVLADEIIRSEHAPALMLHFAEHPEDVQRISTLRTPTEVVIETRVIARGLEAATAGNSPEQPAKPAISKAGPPVRPVAGPPAISEPGYRPGMSIDEYAKHWNKTQLPKFLQR